MTNEHEIQRMAEPLTDQERMMADRLVAASHLEDIAEKTLLSPYGPGNVYHYLGKCSRMIVDKGMKPSELGAMVRLGVQKFEEADGQS